jgi:hypothetical protein
MQHMIRRRYKTDVHEKDFYNYYKTKSKNPVDKNIFIKIVKEFNDSICHACIYNNFEFKMPARLGIIRLKKRKARATFNEDGSLNTRYLAVDWKSTKELWSTDPTAKEHKQIVFHLNRHSKGYIFTWHWERFNMNLVNKSAYHLDMMRKHDREITKAINNPDLNIDCYV